MNEHSLAHTYAQKQDNPSWNDDPFNLKGFFTRTVIVNHERNLYEFSQSLVNQYGKYLIDHYELTLDMIPEYEQNELARLYIETLDREIEWACYGDDESINSDFLCALLSMLKSDTKEARENFAEITRKNILVYYRLSLEKILSNAAEDYSNYIVNGNSYHSYQDDDYEVEL
jgi:hypothetical protein